MDSNLIYDDLNLFVSVFPKHISSELYKLSNFDDLLEIALDIGRVPEVRFGNGASVFLSKEIQFEDLNYIIGNLGEFGDDNRAGIERTLHRFSAIRNRKKVIIGLTCRIGRAVFGTIQVIQDLLSMGKSILLLGKPGVGKTTMLREIARILADQDQKRVVIVDTSNEIAGDGDIPHTSIGKARRLQVTASALQHAVMIEAVENHMPEVVIIDEMSTELEAFAARTIAERGVQLIATAHGGSLENLILNPSLADLIGGINAVTLGDDEARRRGTQKTILERKSPPTFEIIVEINNRNLVIVHKDVGTVIDKWLRGSKIIGEKRSTDQTGKIIKTQLLVNGMNNLSKRSSEKFPQKSKLSANSPQISVFPIGINSRKFKLLDQINTKVNFVESMNLADFIVTTRAYYRKEPRLMKNIENSKKSLYVLKRSSGYYLKEFLKVIERKQLKSFLTNRSDYNLVNIEQEARGNESNQQKYIKTIQEKYL